MCKYTFSNSLDAIASLSRSIYVIQNYSLSHQNEPSSRLVLLKQSSQYKDQTFASPSSLTRTPQGELDRLVTMRRVNSIICNYTEDALKTLLLKDLEEEDHILAAVGVRLGRFSGFGGFFHFEFQIKESDILQHVSI